MWRERKGERKWVERYRDGGREREREKYKEREGGKVLTN